MWRQGQGPAPARVVLLRSAPFKDFPLAGHGGLSQEENGEAQSNPVGFKTVRRTMMRPKAMTFSKCVAAVMAWRKETHCIQFSWEKSTERFMKYHNGSPYVAVIRLVIDVARCLLEMCGRWDGPEKRALPVDGWMD